MAVTGWKTPGTAANADRDGKLAWSNPDNAKVSDNNYAVSTPIYTYGDWLRLTNFGFTSTDIPAGSIIDGIEVKVERKAGVTNTFKDSAFYLRKTSGQVGDNKASSAWWSTTEESITYGGAADTWNAGLAQADIVSSDFGIDLSGTTATLYNGSVDCISIRVYYTAAAPQYITPASVTVKASIQAPTLAGSGAAPVTPSPVTVKASIQAPTLAGSGAAPVTPSPVTVKASIQAPVLSGSGVAQVALVAIVAKSAVQAPVLSGSGSASITLVPIAVVGAVQAPTLSGSGSAPITPSPVVVMALIQAPEVAGTGVAPIILSPVTVMGAVQAPAVSGSGAAIILLVPVTSIAAIQAPVISGSGSAIILLLPVEVVASVVAPALSRSSMAVFLLDGEMGIRHYLGVIPGANFRVSGRRGITRYR